MKFHGTKRNLFIGINTQHETKGCYRTFSWLTCGQQANLPDLGFPGFRVILQEFAGSAESLSARLRPSDPAPETPFTVTVYVVPNCRSIFLTTGNATAVVG